MKPNTEGWGTPHKILVKGDNFKNQLQTSNARDNVPNELRSNNSNRFLLVSQLSPFIHSFYHCFISGFCNQQELCGLVIHSSND